MSVKLMYRFQCWRLQEWTRRNHSQWPGKSYHAVLRCFHTGRWATDRRRGQEPAYDQSREYSLRRQASDWPTVRRVDGPAGHQVLPVQSQQQEQQAEYRGPGCIRDEELQSGRDLGNGADEDEGDRWSVPWQEGDPRRGDGSRVLQRCSAAGNKRCWHNCWLERHANHQRAVSIVLHTFLCHCYCHYVWNLIFIKNLIWWI